MSLTALYPSLLAGASEENAKGSLSMYCSLAVSTAFNRYISSNVWPNNETSVKLLTLVLPSVPPGEPGGEPPVASLGDPPGQGIPGAPAARCWHSSAGWL